MTTVTVCFELPSVLTKLFIPFFISIFLNIASKHIKLTKINKLEKYHSNLFVVFFLHFFTMALCPVLPCFASMPHIFLRCMICSTPVIFNRQGLAYPIFKSFVKICLFFQYMYILFTTSFHITNRWYKSILS